MQVIKFFDGSERILEDDESENVKSFWLKDTDRPIALRDGSVINPKAISNIGEADTIPTWSGYPLSKNGTSFIRDGDRIYLEPHNFSEIEHRLDPKYGRGTPVIRKGDDERKRIGDGFKRLGE